MTPEERMKVSGHVLAEERASRDPAEEAHLACLENRKEADAAAAEESKEDMVRSERQIRTWSLTISWSLEWESKE